MTAAPATGTGSRTAPERLDWLIVGWLTLLTALSTVFAVFFLPQYVGTVPVPVSALVGAGVVLLCTRLGYRLTGSMLAAFAPALGWLAAAVTLSFSRTLGYALVIADWRATLLLGAGALAAAMGVGLSWGSHQLVPAGLPDGPAVPGVTRDRAPAER